MKKLVFASLISMALFSCGKEKKTEEVKQPEKVNKYAVRIDGIYKEDDSISVVYKLDTYFQYEKALGLKVKGAPEVQSLLIDVPEGIAVENVQLTVSTNKNQKEITLKNIIILNDKKEVYNVSNQSITDYFDFNPGISLDFNTRVSPLNFEGKYPPGLTGNQNLEGELLK